MKQTLQQQSPESLKTATCHCNHDLGFWCNPTPEKYSKIIPATFLIYSTVLLKPFTVNASIAFYWHNVKVIAWVRWCRLYINAPSMARELGNAIRWPGGSDYRGSNNPFKKCRIFAPLSEAKPISQTPVCNLSNTNYENCLRNTRKILI